MSANTNNSTATTVSEMDPEVADKKIIDLSDAELTALGFIGPDVPGQVQELIDAVRADPVNMGFITCFQVECVRRCYAIPPRIGSTSSASLPSPMSPTLADTLYSTLSSDSAAFTIVAPHLVTPFERRLYYRGISARPPELMYRSDLGLRAFPTPTPGSRFFNAPIKTANGVFGHRLNAVWENEVCSKIRALFKEHGIVYTSLKTVRFTMVFDGETSIGPVVIWIAVRPNTTNARALSDFTPLILDVLRQHQITDVVVEWYEGVVKRLAGPGPKLRPVTVPENPIFGWDHPFNSGLGIPISDESRGVQGTLAFIFREIETRDGAPSDRVLGVTNKHVVNAITSTDYEFDGADPQHVLMCSDERVERAIADIHLELAKMGHTMSKPRTTALEKQAGESIMTALEALDHEINAAWMNAISRRFGVVDWAPQISVRVDDHCYTRDMGTFVIDPAKIENFKKNVVDLGKKYTPSELEDRFWPRYNPSYKGNRSIPDDLQLPIRRALPRLEVLNPTSFDVNGEPLYIVAKYGSATDLTLGRCSGTVAWICDESRLESKEVAIYNYDKTEKTDFADHGDSGALVFTGNGEALAMIHSGEPVGITYCTPIWWIMEQILERYPHADFLGIEYTPNQS